MLKIKGELMPEGKPRALNLLSLLPWLIYDFLVSEFKFYLSNVFFDELFIMKEKLVTVVGSIMQDLQFNVSWLFTNLTIYLYYMSVWHPTSPTYPPHMLPHIEETFVHSLPTFFYFKIFHIKKFIVDK